jgi:hypothetical protein
MTSIANASTAELISLGSRLVGATFLWAAGIKAIAPHTFSRHLMALGWIPRRWMALAVTAAAALEAGLGIALLVNLAPGLLLPSTFALLFVLTGTAVWGVRSGKTTDCGCYGGYIQPSIGQSVGLNALFASLVAAAWLAQPRVMVSAAWQLIVVAATIIVFGALTHSAQRFKMKHGRPMIETSPLRVGRRWKHSSAGGATSNVEGEIFVSYLGPDCPHCARWVKWLNAIHQSPGLPAVVGVVAASGEQLDSYIAEKGIRFPVATVSRTLMGRLTEAVPTTVLVNAGKIAELWEGMPPPEFVDRFRRAFFPDPVEALTEKSS